jgi:hypothetical protein
MSSDEAAPSMSIMAVTDSTLSHMLGTVWVSVCALLPAQQRAAACRQKVSESSLLLMSTPIGWWMMQGLLMNQHA